MARGRIGGDIFRPADWQTHCRYAGRHVETSPQVAYQWL
jgi:hypothetical protein